MIDDDRPLETERLILRRITLGDAGLMLSIWNDPAFLKHVGDRGIRTLRQARAAVEENVFGLYEKHGYGPFSLSLKTGGHPVGICGLFRRDNLEHPDIGFAVLPDHRGAGLAGEAARAVVAHARDTLGIEYLKAIVSPGNRASVNLLEKLGFELEGAIRMPGDEHDISLYGMRLL